jgi:hypothetical protein
LFRYDNVVNGAPNQSSSVPERVAVEVAAQIAKEEPLLSAAIRATEKLITEITSGSASDFQMLELPRISFCFLCTSRQCRVPAWWLVSMVCMFVFACVCDLFPPAATFFGSL